MGSHEFFDQVPQSEIDGLTTALAGKAATSHAHAGADITSGTVAYARLPVGTAASTVAAGDDARLTDARTPTAHVHAAADVSSGTLDVARVPTGTSGTTVALGNHTHSYAAVSHAHAGADITSGTVDAARLPVVLSPVRTVAFSATPTIDPTVSGTNVSITIPSSGGGDITALAVSTTGAVNRQGLEVVVLASGATRAVTFASAIRTSTGITRGPYSIASGQIGIFLVKYYTLISAWVLVAATVSAT